MKPRLLFGSLFTAALSGCSLYSPPIAPLPDTTRVPIGPALERKVKADLSHSFPMITKPEFLHMDAGKDAAGTLFVCGRIKEADKSYGTAIPYMAIIFSNGVVRPVLVPRSETQNTNVYLSCLAKGLM